MVKMCKDHQCIDYTKPNTNLLMETARVSNPRENLKSMDILNIFKAFDTHRHVGVDLLKLKSYSSSDKIAQNNSNSRFELLVGDKLKEISLLTLLVQQGQNLNEGINCDKEKEPQNNIEVLEKETVTNHGVTLYEDKQDCTQTNPI